MRVVAGTARGRRLVAPARGQVRPTSDRVREAVFGSLTSMGAVEGAEVLDLFAGTGALAIEALSRGAEGAVLVERDRSALGAIRQNLETTGLAARAEVVASEALAYLEGCSTRFDLLLLDPPYGLEAWDLVLAGVARLANPGAVAVVESGAEVPLPPPWHVERDKRYGGTFVRIATLRTDPTQGLANPR